MGKIINFNSKKNLTIEQLGLEDLFLGFLAPASELYNIPIIVSTDNDIINVATKLIFRLDEEDCLALIFPTNSDGKEVVHLIDKQSSVIFTLPRIDCIETIRDIVISTGIGHMLILEQSEENVCDLVY